MSWIGRFALGRGQEEDFRGQRVARLSAPQE